MTVELTKDEAQLLCTLLDEHKESFLAVDSEIICRMRRKDGRCNPGDCDGGCEYYLYHDRYATYLENLIKKLES